MTTVTEQMTDFITDLVTRGVIQVEVKGFDSNDFGVTDDYKLTRISNGVDIFSITAHYSSDDKLVVNELEFMTDEDEDEMVIFEDDDQSWDLLSDIRVEEV